MKDKTKEAKETIKKCQGPQGFYASGDVYYGQYWTRDLVYSLEALLDLGYQNLIEKQFRKIKQKQKESGEVPAVIYSSQILKILPSWIKIFLRDLTAKKENCSGYPWSDLKMTFSLVINHYHSWLADSELLFVIGLKQSRVDLEIFKQSIQKAMKFTESKIDPLKLLLTGSGWADAMKNYLGKISFLINVLLYKEYLLVGKKDQAIKIRKVINDVFWDDEKGCYVNFLGGDRFDTIAHALALEWKIIPESRIDNIVKKFTRILTKAGYRNIDFPYSKRECNLQPYFYQNSASWPFIDARVIKCLKHLGFDKEAKEGFKKLSALRGFNEWYYPFTAEPKGSKHQLWSAAGYLMVRDLF